jgi:TonB family protein
MVKDRGATIYSNAFKDFLINRFDRECEELTHRQFACAAEIPAATLRTWLVQSGGPLQAAMPASSRLKRMVVYLFVEDTINLWPSVLKENYRRRLALGLGMAAFLNFMGVNLYTHFSHQEPQAQTVRITKYTEIVLPELKEIAKREWEEAASGRRPAAGIVARNFEVVPPRAKKEEKDADADSEEAKLKKAGVLSMIEDDLAPSIDPIFSTGGKSLSNGRSRSGAAGVGGANADVVLDWGGLGTGESGNGSIETILKNDAENNKPAIKLEKKSKIDVAPIAKVSGSQEAVGARNEQSLYQVLSQNIGRLQYIYEKFLKTNPEIRGKVEVEVTINPDGSVANVVVLSSEIPLQDFQQQIRDAVRRWKYEAVAQGQMKVVYPIVFNKVS